VNKELNGETVMEIVRDYIAVNIGWMSQNYFCDKWGISLREFSKVAYAIEEELEKLERRTNKKKRS